MIDRNEVLLLYLRVHAVMIHKAQHFFSISARVWVETTMFVAQVHLIALLTLLHINYVSTTATSCLATGLQGIQATAAPIFRIDVVPSLQHTPELENLSPSSTCSNASYPLASFLFATQQYTLLHHSTTDLMTIQVARNSACFELHKATFIGLSPLWDIIVDHVLGYDTIIINRIVQLRASTIGVVMNTQSGLIHSLSDGVFQPPGMQGTGWVEFITFRFHTLFLCVSLFFAFVALIAYIVTQFNILVVAWSELFVYRQRRRSLLSMVRYLVTYSIQTLLLIPVVLGMWYCLFELYKDPFIAIGILVTMCIGECFSIISARTRLTQLYFPPLFFCWFTLFHTYLIAFPYGFTHIAWVCFTLAILQTILFFYNCIEIPALLNGEISIENPRERIHWGQNENIRHEETAVDDQNDDLIAS